VPCDILGLRLLTHSTFIKGNGNEYESGRRHVTVPIIAGGISLVLSALGFAFLGEALRKMCDPRLRHEK
jgi:ABC-type dipeptide/oligopeptide/nickel transport system permease subunit